MLTIKKQSINIETICCYILAALIVISTRSIWLYTTDAVISHEYLVIILDFFILVYCLTYGFKRINFKIKVTRTSVIVIAIAIIYVLFARTNYLVYIINFLFTLIVSVLFLSCLSEKNKVWYCLTNVVVFLAVISLVFYLGGTIFNIIPNTGTTEFEWVTTRTCNNYFNLYYESQRIKVSEGLYLARNCGIFTEAPMYNFVLDVALGIELFMKVSPNKIKCGILIITIITTLSTTGMVFIVGCLFLYYVNSALKSKRRNGRFLLILGVALLAAIVVYELYASKLNLESGSNSISIRNDHVIACIRAWFHNPLYGLGYNNLDAVLQYSNYLQGMSVGWFYSLATGGIMLTSVFLIPFIIQFIKNLKMKEYKLVFFDLLFLYIYMITAVSNTPIVVFYIAYMLTAKKPCVNLNYNYNTGEEKHSKWGVKTV